ncbi:MAG: hypothetical protein ABL957_01290 [Parvularculaceae bacterium]
MTAANRNLAGFSRFGAAALAAAFLAVAAPAEAREVTIEIDRDVILGGDGDLLEKLIALDAEGIAEMRADMAEALIDIDDAIGDIKEAREEINEEAGLARFIVKVAFATARSTAKAAISEAMEDARREVDEAEADLRTAGVSADERVETQGAIDGLRTDLAALEKALARLMAELHVD